MTVVLVKEMEFDLNARLITLQITVALLKQMMMKLKIGLLITRTDNCVVLVKQLDLDLETRLVTHYRCWPTVETDEVESVDRLDKTYDRCAGKRT